MEVIKIKSKLEVENWVGLYSDHLYSWALHKTSSKETAEDLVQETFLAAFHKIESFQGKSQPKTWLFSILNNKIIDYYRLSAKTTNINFSLSESTANQRSENLFTETGCWKDQEINPIWEQEQELLDNPEFNNVMHDCLEELPKKWKIAITSKYLTDKKAEEICQELEITASNYWQIVHRGKLLIKKCLEVKWVS